MAIWDTSEQSQDAHPQDKKAPVSSRTIGGTQVVPKSISGESLTSIIDNQSNLIVYQDASGNVIDPSSTEYASELFYGAGYTHMAAQGYTASLQFSGTRIGILAGTGPNNGPMEVYIDGVRAYGRSPHTTQVRGAINNGSALIAATTKIGDGSFDLPGYFLVDNEIVGYTSSVDNFTVTGITYGQFGTQSVSHPNLTTMWQWTQNPQMNEVAGSVKSYGSRRMVFYNPFLDPGQHTVTIKVGALGSNGSSSGAVGFDFDGFVVGPQVGAQSIGLEFGTFDATVTTDANGHANLGSLNISNGEIAFVAVVGYTQTSPDTSVSNATAMAKLGLTWVSDGTSFGKPSFYLHNGPVGLVTIRATIAYLGKTI